MLGLHPADLAVIVLYFAGMLAIGFWSMRRIKTQEDYFLGGRRFGKLIQTFAAFGQATSSDTGPSVATTTYHNGASGTWSALFILFATPFYWMIAPWYRRFRCLTMGDFFEERYGSKALAGTYAVVSTVALAILLSVGYIAMTKTVMALTPKSPAEMTGAERAEYGRAVELQRLEAADYATLGEAGRARLHALRLENPRMSFSHISPELVVFLTAFIVIVYSVAGGLEAAFLTDLVQGLFIIFMSVLLYPFAIAKINAQYGGGGILDAFRTVHRKLPASFFEIFGSPAVVDFTWYYILAIGVMSLLNVAQGANMVSSTGSARNEYAARFGFTTGLYIKRVCTVLWGVLALLLVLLYGGSLRDPDLLWGHACRDLLGSLNLGLAGLMIACMMAALMSTADCLMITSSSLLTRNVYHVIRPGLSESHYIRVGRILGAGTVVGGAALLLYNDNLFEQLKLNWEFGGIFAAPFWLGILWRRATRPAAWCSILLSFLAFFAVPAVLPMVAPGLRAAPGLLTMTAPRVIDRRYAAHEMDVDRRRLEIAAWEKRTAAGEEAGPRPEPLAVGQPWVQSFQLPQKSIFWSRGIRKDGDGRLRGQGLLSFDLVLIHRLGFDLTKNTYAFNETLRVLIRIGIPFLILLLVSYLTRKDERAALDRFYARMKTPVQADREADAREVERSNVDPRRFDPLKMFPRTHWEFCRWDREDVVGFSLAAAAAVAIVLFFYLGVQLGG